MEYRALLVKSLELVVEDENLKKETLKEQQKEMGVKHLKRKHWMT